MGECSVCGASERDARDGWVCQACRAVERQAVGDADHIAQLEAELAQAREELRLANRQLEWVKQGRDQAERAHVDLFGLYKSDRELLAQARQEIERLKGEAQDIAEWLDGNEPELAKRLYAIANPKTE